MNALISFAGRGPIAEFDRGTSVATDSLMPR
jgi:hypothetical protein